MDALQSVASRRRDDKHSWPPVEMIEGQTISAHPLAKRSGACYVDPPGHALPLRWRRIWELKSSVHRIKYSAVVFSVKQEWCLHVGGDALVYSSLKRMLLGKKTVLMRSILEFSRKITGSEPYEVGWSSFVPKLFEGSMRWYSCRPDPMNERGAVKLDCPSWIF